MDIHSPAQATYWLISGRILFLIIPLLGVTCSTYIMVKRMVPLLRSAPDSRLDHISVRLMRILQFWLGQWTQPRYLIAGGSSHGPVRRFPGAVGPFHFSREDGHLRAFCHARVLGKWGVISKEEKVVAQLIA